jgi:hypothetical protein
MNGDDSSDTGKHGHWLTLALSLSMNDEKRSAREKDASLVQRVYRQHRNALLRYVYVRVLALRPCLPFVVVVVVLHFLPHQRRRLLLLPPRVPLLVLELQRTLSLLLIGVNLENNRGVVVCGWEVEAERQFLSAGCSMLRVVRLCALAGGVMEGIDGGVERGC